MSQEAIPPGSGSDDETNAPTKKEETQQEDAPEDSQYPSGIKLIVIVIALVLAVLLFAIDQTIVATAVPRITDEFNSLEDISWYGSAFFMTIGAFQSTWGKANKYFPLKTNFLIAIFIFELGSLICAVAQNSTTLIVGRAVAGVGGAGMGSGAYTIIGFATRPQMRAAFTGVIGAAYGVGAVLGPLVGGSLTDRVSWRWCFYINLPIGGVAALIIILFFQTPPAAKPVKAPLREKLLQMDPLGTVLIMGAIISLILALQYGGVEESWNSSEVIGLLVGFFVIVIAFAISEMLQGERAMLPTRLMRERTIWVNSAVCFFFAGSYFVILYMLPIYFQSIDNASPINSGVRNLPLIISLSFATVFSGGFISKTGIATPLLVIGAVLSTVGAGLLYTLDIGTGSGKWIGYQILEGVGVGLAFQIPIIVCQSSVDPSDLASATAIMLFFQTVGGAALLSAAQAGFVNTIIRTLASVAPEIDPGLVVATGATALRDVFPPDQLRGVLLAYMEGIKVAFAITIATLGISTFVSVLSRWKRINTEKVTGGAA